ncbi:unnamed protein product [Phytomonas sp. Hart1]|nr:unnamed protein product [Phytomonas sp. Hart1]|eukprot:CCW66644.1 unnamed protein product [Phytomonas sp. isolate Hart1]
MPFVSDAVPKTACNTQALNRLQSLCYEPSIPVESRQKLLAVLNTLQSSNHNTLNTVSLQPNNDGLSNTKQNKDQTSKGIDIHAPLWHRAYAQNDGERRSRAVGFNVAMSPFRNFAKSNSFNKRSLPVLQDHTETFAQMNKVMCQTIRYVESVSELEFDINDVKEYDNSIMVDKERLFMSVCCSIFSNFSLTTTLSLDISKLTNFLIDIFNYYSEEHYFHTALHAADSLQMLSLFFREPNTNFLFTDEEILLAFLSVLCMDIANPALHSMTLVELNHPLVTVFGNLSVKKQASLIVFLHQLFLDENFFMTMPQSMLYAKNLLQESLNTIVIFTSSRLRSYLMNQLRCVAMLNRVDGESIPYLLSALTHLSVNAFAFRPRRQWVFWGNCLYAEWKREAEERQRHWLGELFPNLNYDPRSAVATLVGYCASTVKPLADVVKSLVPTDLYDNLERNVDRVAVEAEMESTRCVFSIPKETRTWSDNSSSVIEILRKNTAHANSLDRKASKCAILNASPQRSVTYSMERQNSIMQLSCQPSISDIEVDCFRACGSEANPNSVSPTRSEHYFSFLRLYDEFERSGRSSLDFLSKLIFFALQLDPHYIGRYARDAFGDDCTAQQCGEMAVLIRSVEDTPSTAEAIVNSRSRSHGPTSMPDESNNTDGFILLLMNMYIQREEETERLVSSHILQENISEDTECDYKTSPSNILRLSKDNKTQRDSPIRLPDNPITLEVKNSFSIDSLISDLESSN